MSKKLIAVASAAALALSALVAAPASASTFSVTMDGGTNVGSTATDATTVNVPTLDVVRFNTTEANSSAVEYTVNTTTATGVVTVSTTGSVKVIGEADYTAAHAVAANVPTSKSGATTLSLAAAGSKAIFYAFTTSTENGTVTITNAGNSVTYFVEGIAGLAYNVTVTGPATASKGVDYKFSATVTDVFGNPITSGLTIDEDGFVVDQLGAFTAAPELSTAVGNGTKGVWNFEVATAESGAGLLTVEVGGEEAVADDIAGFPDASLSATLSVNSADPATTITALTAQIAALQVIVDRKVTKKRYNTLARKWNRAFPSQKVWVKP
jgi:hypothetical protein